MPDTRRDGFRATRLDVTLLDTQIRSVTLRYGVHVMQIKDIKLIISKKYDFKCYKHLLL